MMRKEKVRKLKTEIQLSIPVLHIGVVKLSIARLQQLIQMFQLTHTRCNLAHKCNGFLSPPDAGLDPVSRASHPGFEVAVLGWEHPGKDPLQLPCFHFMPTSSSEQPGITDDI